MRDLMRSRLTGALLAVLGAGCSKEVVPQPPPAPIDWASLNARPAPSAAAPTPLERERASGNAYLKALASPGLSELGAALDDDAHCRYAGARDLRGREHVVELHDALFGAFDPRSFAVRRFWLTPASSAIEWTMTGVQARDWLGIPASRKSVTIHGITLLWTKYDGLITEVHVYFDEALVKAELGVGPKELLALPPPPAPSGAREDVEQAGTNEESANVMRVRDALDALEDKEVAYVEAMTDDVEVLTPSRARPGRGKEEARAYWKAMHKAVGRLDTAIHNIWGFEQFVVVEYAITGWMTGPYGWVPARKDSAFELAVVDVVELRDGRIARVWRYDNPSELLSKP